uniref:Hydroxysteroid 17-beta dehydrogenase 2 n=1 Tax=Sphenodon punctatus TaxID=8508 RepID=A0A8D0GM97_SPHPU
AGTDSGIGHELAKYLDRLGFIVFAGVLNKKGPGAEELKRSCSQRLSILQMDITNSAHVKEAYLKVTEEVKNAGLWGVVNNAGIMGLIADGELLPMSAYTQCMDVNFFGTVRVSKTFLPLLRKSKGRLVNISSMAGNGGIPKQYAPNRLIFFPGILGTPELWDEQERNLLENLTPDVKRDYGEDYILALKTILSHMPAFCGSDLSPVLCDVRHALLAKSPCGLYTPGKNSYKYLCLFSYFPLRFYDFFIRRLQNIEIVPRALREPEMKCKNA